MIKGKSSQISRFTLVLLAIGLIFSISAGSVNINEISFEEGQHFKGSLVKGKVFLENTKSEQAFFLEYTVNGENYKKGSVIWLPEDIETMETFYFEVPEDYDQRYLEVHCEVYNNYYSDTRSKTLLVSDKQRNFRTSLSSDELFVSAGEEGELEVQVLNVGNQPDSYTVSLKGWKSYEFSEKKFKLNPSESKNVSLEISAPQEKRAGKRTLDVKICGVDECDTKNLDFYLDKPEENQSVVREAFSEEVEFSNLSEREFSPNVTNIGAGEKTYTQSFEGNSSMFSADYDEFDLDVNETDDITFTITPESNQSFNVTYILYSENEEIFEHEFKFKYEDEEKEKPLITGAFVGSEDGFDPFVLLLVYGFAAVGFLALVWNAYNIYNKYRFERDIDLFNKTLKR